MPGAIPDPPFKRLPIRIAVAPATETTPAMLYALANDGTIWAMDKDIRWTRFPDLPQPARTTPAQETR